MNNLKVLTVFLMMLLYLSGFALENQGVRTIEKSVKTIEGKTLYMDVQSGSIYIEHHEKMSVDVNIIVESKRGDSAKLEKFMSSLTWEIKEKNKDVHINVFRENKLNLFQIFRNRDIQIRYNITVPYRYNATLKTSGGGIYAYALKGTVHAETSGGNLKFGDIDGKIFCRTSGGSIQLDKVTMSVDARTSGGSIKIGEAYGNIDARTSGGSIAADGVKGNFNLVTSGGSVKIKLNEQPNKNSYAKTSGGSIHLLLNKAVSFNLDASTSGGSIRSDWMPDSDEHGHSSKRSLQKRINGGGPEIVLRTSGGNITISEM